jgi:GAF domain-containing protein
MDLQQIADELLAATRASRVTIRLPAEDAFFPIQYEALAPGTHSLRGDTTIDLAAAATFQELKRTLRPLVQDDVLTADVSVPPELIDAYRVRAQILAPIVHDGELAGVVSVHYAPGPRSWTGEDVAAATQAAADVQATL